MSRAGRARHLVEYWGSGRLGRLRDRGAGPCRYALETVGLREGVLPDYLIIGAMKAATTMLYEWLVTHPLCPAAVEKEVHFFDFHYLRGANWYRSQLPTRHQLERAAEGCPTPLSARPSRPERGLSGEASPTYLFHPLAPRRAAATVPNAKLVVILRDPVARAYSHYQISVRHDWETLPFEDALDREPRRLEGQVDALLLDEQNNRSFPRYRWSYQAMGHYAEMLERWFVHFPREQVHVVFNEHLVADPQRLFDDLDEFLGIPGHRLPPRNRRVRGQYSPIEPATAERLRTYFAPHDARLSDLLGVDLPWR